MAKVKSLTLQSVLLYSLLEQLPRVLWRVGTRAVVLESGLGLDQVQQYMLFFLFHNKDSLVPQMGNVMAIGLTPSRTGIAIGRLLNAQLRHMSV